MRVINPDILMNKPLHHIAEAINSRGPSGSRSLLHDFTLEKELEIAKNLQTSLDPTRLIELFSKEVAALIPHQGVRYRNDDLDVLVKLGTQARHSCSYKLNLGDEPLGKLTFRRNRKFSDVEISTLEHLLCTVLYPLRNALLYQDALQLAQKDPLTGICNRSALDETLQRELSHAQRRDTGCALLILDIDNFKNINDRYGHIVGDCAIRAIANMMAACKRDGDLLFRYGGEEFVVLMRDADLEGAVLLAERIRGHIERNPCTWSGADLHMTASIGVSILQPNDSPVSLFARADQSLYRAKREGRNRICVAENCYQ